MPSLKRGTPASTALQCLGFMLTICGSSRPRLCQQIQILLPAEALFKAIMTLKRGTSWERAVKAQQSSVWLNYIQYFMPSRLLNALECPPQLQCYIDSKKGNEHSISALVLCIIFLLVIFVLRTNSEQKSVY